MKKEPAKPAKSKTPNILSSTSSDKGRKTVVHGKVTRDDKGSKK